MSAAGPSAAKSAGLRAVLGRPLTEDVHTGCQHIVVAQDGSYGPCDAPVIQGLRLCKPHAERMAFPEAR